MGPPGEPGKPWGTRSVNPYASGGSTPTWGGGGGRTPAWGGGGRTPNPSSDSRTPAWNASSRTPNPYANNAQTPAWNVSSRTPNPYADGGKTPAWNVSSRTPNPYASNNGGATPARNTNTWGGATPGRNAWDASTGWGDSWVGVLTVISINKYLTNIKECRAYTSCGNFTCICCTDTRTWDIRCCYTV